MIHYFGVILFICSFSFSRIFILGTDQSSTLLVCVISFMSDLFSICLSGFQFMQKHFQFEVFNHRCVFKAYINTKSSHVTQSLFFGVVQQAHKQHNQKSLDEIFLVLNQMQVVVGICTQPDANLCHNLQYCMTPYSSRKHCSHYQWSSNNLEALDQ